MKERGIEWIIMENEKCNRIHKTVRKFTSDGLVLSIKIFMVKSEKKYLLEWRGIKCMWESISKWWDKTNKFWGAFCLVDRGVLNKVTLEGRVGRGCHGGRGLQPLTMSPEGPLAGRAAGRAGAPTTSSSPPSLSTESIRRPPSFVELMNFSNLSTGSSFNKKERGKCWVVANFQ